MNHRSLTFILLMQAFFLLPACAKIQVGELPVPVQTARVRVYVQPHTTVHEGKGQWDTPHEEFVKGQIRQIKKYLADTGIYEVVSNEDVQAVLGEQHFTRFDMQKNDWALARRIGKALHADYVMVMERGTQRLLNTKYFSNTLINVDTGRKFGARYSFATGVAPGRMKEIIRASYRDIFLSAKEDLLATAVKKSQIAPLPAQTARIEPESAALPEGSAMQVTEKEPQVAVRSEAPLTPVVTPAVQTPAPAAPAASESLPTTKELQAADRDWMQERDAEKVLTQESPSNSGTRLVVYDLDATEQYRPVALILTEALREELFHLKQFTLVNRENLQEVLKEMALQQTGLIDEKQAVATGKGLAANQVVTGRLGLLGKTYMLQTKRIDVESFATLSFASAQFRQGQEEAVLEKIPGLARQLMGLR